MSYRCGFVGLVGPTNSGKSTLMNALVGEKVSIVSPLPQTTYHGIRGILNRKTSQLILTDTPGFQRHPDALPRLLNRVADKNAEDSDQLVWVFDASNPRVRNQFEKLSPKIKASKRPELSFCVLNKVDKVNKLELLPLIQQISESGLFSEIIPVSARTGDGVKVLEEVLVQKLPEGEAMYGKDQRTDRPMSFRISEIVREKIYRSTKEEVPYSVFIEMEEDFGGEKAERVPNVRVVIHVDSDSRKAILIGKGGTLLKKIGTEARGDIERILGHQICLKLHVHVEPEWKKDANRVNRYLELT